MSNLLALRPAALKTVPAPDSLEYDGESLSLTDQDSARWTVPKSNIAGAIAAMVVPATGVAYTNTGKNSIAVAITGGVVSEITQGRGANTAILFQLGTAAAVDGVVAILAPGDTITFTYTTVPVVSIIPL